MDQQEVRASRFRAQRLDRRPDDDGLVGLVRHLLAVQAQDPAASPLAVRARAEGVTALDLVKAREARAIVRCWGPRGTLHLIAADDLAWFYPLVKPTPATPVRWLRQLGADTDVDKIVGAVDTALRGQGPLSKTQLGDRLAGAGLPVPGPAVVHTAALAAGRGLVVLGPEQNGKPTYVYADDWLGAPVPTETADRGTALRTLVTRYRAAHGPGTAADLAAWSGLPLGELRRAWEREPEPAPAGPDSAGPDSAGPDSEQPPVRLVPAFDEYLLGWRDRDYAVSDQFRWRVYPGGGVIRPAVLVDGLAVGTWRPRRTAARIDITVEPFAPLPDDVGPALAAEAADIGAFLGRDARLTLASQSSS